MDRRTCSIRCLSPKCEGRVREVQVALGEDRCPSCIEKNVKHVERVKGIAEAIIHIMKDTPGIFHEEIEQGEYHSWRVPDYNKIEQRVAELLNRQIPTGDTK